MHLPLFPLQSIFFPGEKVPLHIFESRYRQLINDCKDDAMTFGIPVFMDKLMPYGVEVELKEIVQLHPGGELDVVCVAKRVFKVVTFEKTMKSKLYAGGEVIFVDNILDGDLSLKENIIGAIEELYTLMGVPSVHTLADEFDSFMLAHKIGLSKLQEYELLQMSKESERLLFIKAHLKQISAVLKEVNRTKEVIDLNGHFKNFDPLDFKDFKI
tara:strand:- start:19245 stop:19883 length:639 start_codon:yes stop_codon:yes gene_type:complete